MCSEVLKACISSNYLAQIYIKSTENSAILRLCQICCKFCCFHACLTVLRVCLVASFFSHSTHMLCGSGMCVLHSSGHTSPHYAQATPVCGKGLPGTHPGQLRCCHDSQSSSSFARSGGDSLPRIPLVVREGHLILRCSLPPSPTRFARWRDVSLRRGPSGHVSLYLSRSSTARVTFFASLG